MGEGYAALARRTKKTLIIDQAVELGIKRLKLKYLEQYYGVWGHCARQVLSYTDTPSSRAIAMFKNESDDQYVFQGRPYVPHDLALCRWNIDWQFASKDKIMWTELRNVLVQYH